MQEKNMAMRSGFSHAFATLILTVLSALLVGYFNHVGISSRIFNYLNSVSLKVSLWLENALSIHVSHELIVPLMVATVMAFIWGILFHFVRYGRQR